MKIQCCIAKLHSALLEQKSITTVITVEIDLFLHVLKIVRNP